MFENFWGNRAVTESLEQMIARQPGRPEDRPRITRLARLGPAKPGRSSQVWCSWIIFSGVAWKALAPQRHDSALDLLIRTSRHGHHASASGRRRPVTLTAGPCVSLPEKRSGAGMAPRAGGQPR